MATMLRIGLRLANNRWNYERQFADDVIPNEYSVTCHEWLYKTAYSFLNGATSCRLCIFLIFLVPIIMIIVGICHKDDCRAEEYIPIYLIVAGSFMLAQTFVEGCSRVTESDSLVFNILSGLIDFVMFLWLLAGSYWVYSIFLPDFNDKKSQYYCHQGLYYFALALLFINHLLYTFLFLCGLWTAFVNISF